MTDQKLIAGIFNDFLGLYTGKIQTGIRPLIEKYKNHPMLMGLLSNLDEAAKIQAPKAMKEIYSFYKEYRGRDLEDADWKELTEIMGWTEKHVTSTIFLCWAAQASLYYFYGLSISRNCDGIMFNL